MFEPNWRSCAKIAAAIGWFCCASDERDEEVVPDEEQLEDRQRRDRGQPEREHDLEEDPHSEAPSIRAASIRSLGIPTKKLRSRKIANGSANAVWKRISPGIVSKRLRLL